MLKSFYIYTSFPDRLLPGPFPDGIYLPLSSDKPLVELFSMRNWKLHICKDLDFQRKSKVLSLFAISNSILIPCNF